MEAIINRYDDIGMSARLRAVKCHSNIIRWYSGTNSRDEVGISWARRFIKRNPEYLEKN